MGVLIYSMLVSLDGYVSDADGCFAWARPDDEVERYVTKRFASVGTYLYGRRMYDTMVYWQSAPTSSDPKPSSAAWARQWQDTDKVVYSTTISEPRSTRTRIERAFHPVVVGGRQALLPGRNVARSGAPRDAAFRVGRGRVPLYGAPIVAHPGARSRRDPRLRAREYVVA